MQAITLTALQDLPDLERARTVQAYMRSHHLNKGQLAQELGCRPMDVSDMLAPLQLVESVQELLSERLPAEERLSLRAAAYLGKLSPEAQVAITEHMPPFADPYKQFVWICESHGRYCAGVRNPPRRKPVVLEPGPETAKAQVCVPTPEVKAAEEPPEPPKEQMITQSVESPPIVPPTQMNGAEYTVDKSSPAPRTPMRRYVPVGYRLRRAHTERRHPADVVLGRSVTSEVRTKPANVPSMSLWSGAVTVEYYDAEVFRMVTTSVERWRYEQLWRDGLLKHQRLGLPKPEHLPDVD